MEGKKRAQWGSKIGFILAAAGSAVGLGNIWKFPGKAYEGGGGVFIIIYLLIIVLIGMPVMLTELSLGRTSQANAVDTFRKHNRRFAWVGYLGVIVAFIITSYYAHVGGWVLRYVFSYITEPAKVYSEPVSYFYNMLGLNAATGATFMPWVAIAFAAIFMALNCIIIIRGVEGGIEKFNKVGMPALFLILIALLVRTITMDGVGEGFAYMLSFDFSKLSIQTFLSALGQAFYSLSLGMAIMITYGSYLSKKENITKNTVLICSMDTLVALIAGFIVVPAVFATLGGENVGKGGGFAFVSLAGVFEKMPGGSFFGILFYLLLLFAALTSCISLIESIVAFCTERFGWKRKPATIGICVVMFLIGCLYTCSQAAFPIKGIWFDFTNGITFPAFGDFMEYLTDRLMIPICALGGCLFVGWFFGTKRLIDEVEQGGEFRFAPKRLYHVMIKYIAPISIIVIIAWSLISGISLS